MPGDPGTLPRALGRPGANGRPSSPLRFALFYAAVFLTLGIYLPYWPLWLESRGLGPAEIGAVLAAGSWVKLISNPLAGQIADRWVRPREMLALLTAATVILFSGFLLIRGFWAIFALQLFAAACFQPLIPLSESRTMQAVLGEGQDYGRIRLWGSITFVAGVLAMGWGVEALPADGILWLLLTGLGLTFLAALILPPESGGRTGLDPSGLSWFWRNPGFLAVLGCAALLQSSHAVYYGFSAVAWKGAGLSGFMIGCLWTLGVLAEVIFFAVSTRLLGRFSIWTLLFVAAAAGIVRWSVTGLTTAVPVLVVVQLLHAATFAAGHLAAVWFIARRSPPDLAATAQSLYAAMAGGIAMGVMILVAGWLYGRFGLQAFFAMAAISGLGLSLTVLLRPAMAERLEERTP